MVMVNVTLKMRLSVTREEIYRAYKTPLAEVFVEEVHDAVKEGLYDIVEVEEE